MNEAREGEPAGFASRSAAFVTDAILFGVATSLIGWGIVQVAGFLFRPEVRGDLSPWVVSIGGALLIIAYNVVGWSVFGRTPGKAFFGLAVTTTDGARPGVLRSLLRFVGYVLSTIPLGAGFLWVIVDDHRRGWHDLLAGTRVVYHERLRAGVRASSDPIRSVRRSG